MEDVSFGSWALWRRGGARRLVVGFSSMNTPPGRFRFYSALASPENDALLFNTPQNDWYVNGVPLDANPPSFGQTMAFIRGIAASYDEVVFTGGSMGGYAALLYGSHLDGAHIVAMGPETYPGIQGGFFVRHGVDVAPPNLSRLFSRPGFDPWIIMGEKRFSDLFCLTEIDPARVLTLRNVGHAVPAIVDRLAGGMSQVVSLAVSGALPELLGHRRGSMADWPELSAALYSFSIGRLPLPRAVRFLDVLPDDFYGRAYLSLAVAKRFHRRGRLERSLEFAEHSLEVNPGDLEAHLVHARVVRELRGQLPSPSFQSQVDAPSLLEADYARFYSELCALYEVDAVLLEPRQKRG